MYIHFERKSTRTKGTRAGKEKTFSPFGFSQRYPRGRKIQLFIANFVPERKQDLTFQKKNCKTSRRYAYANDLLRYY